VSLVKKIVMLCDGRDWLAHHMRFPGTDQRRERGEDQVKDQTAAAPAGPDSAPRAPTRLVQREPSDRVVAIGLRDPWLGDLYHHLLTLPWWAFLLGWAAVYLGLNMLFAVLYLLGDAAVANARPGAFSDAFFFSVETISTIGYGQMSPATLYGNIVMTVEAMFGLILLAASAGVVLARFSRPTARVMFSNVAVVAPYNGVPTLSFRISVFCNGGLS
jgi:inward rectifier potassium channel